MERDLWCPYDLPGLLSTLMGVYNIDVGFNPEVQPLVPTMQVDLYDITSISFHKASYFYNATTSKSFHKKNERGPYQV